MRQLHSKSDLSAATQPKPSTALQSWACRQQRHETTLVSASVVGRKVRRGSPHIRPGVRLECFDQPRANILGFFYAFCQTGREGLESDESVVNHRSGMIHGRTPLLRRAFTQKRIGG